MLRIQKIKVSPKKVQIKACSINESSCDYHLSIYGNFCQSCPQAPKKQNKRINALNLIRKFLELR
jgi:hypothetical protein